MSEQEIKDSIANYVIEIIGDNISSVEENCGSIWLETETGDTWFIQVEKCQKQENE